MKAAPNEWGKSVVPEVGVVAFKSRLVLTVFYLESLPIFSAPATNGHKRKGGTGTVLHACPSLLPPFSSTPKGSTFPFLLLPSNRDFRAPSGLPAPVHWCSKRSKKGASFWYVFFPAVSEHFHCVSNVFFWRECQQGTDSLCSASLVMGFLLGKGKQIPWSRWACWLQG